MNAERTEMATRTPGPARTPREVAVLTERATGPHVVVASLRFHDRGLRLTREELHARLRSEAARLGKDAVVAYGETNTGHFVAAGAIVGSTPTVGENHLLADVIVLTGGSREPGSSPR